MTDPLSTEVRSLNLETCPRAWYSVDEALPHVSLVPNSFGVQVLIWPPHKSGGASDAHVAFYGCRIEDEPCFYLYGRGIEVTHWMPLPKGPT